MKKTFISTGNMPGTRDFTATLFTLESDNVNSIPELKDLARKAVKQYALTDEGFAVYSNNCDNFNWGDMVNNADSKIFKEICNNIGLKVVWLGSTDSDDLWVDENEQLMEDLSVEVEDIDWDTDGELIDELPTELTLILDNPTVDIADVLSDEYGFCVNSYSVNEVF